MEHLVKIRKPSMSDINTMDGLVNAIKGYLAQHYCVKYNWEYADVDMNKKYQEGSLEAYRVEQNKCIKKTKKRDDESIFIDTIKNECKEWCCVSFCKPIIFIRKTYIEVDFDGTETKRLHEGFEYDLLFDFYETENNYSIEKEIMEKIDYQEIVNFVKTHTEEEVIDKYASDDNQKEYFWGDYV